MLLINNMNPTYNTMNSQNDDMTNTLQFSLLNKFSTGNPFFDPLINTFLYTMISIFVFNMKNILNLAWIKYYFDKFYSLIKFYYSKYIKKEDMIINKQAVIDYITDNKKVNNLYKAVDWYLSTKYNEDYIKESPLKLSYEEDPLQVDPLQIELNRRITSNKFKSLMYKNHEIFFILNNNIITVYTDKEKKRENYTITLNTQMRKDSETDILDDFCQMCLNEFIKSKKSNKWVQKIYINNADGKWIPQESNNKRKIDTVILPDDKLEDIKQDIDDFIESEDWYHDRDIQYTRGYLLYGHPGTGKTSLIKGMSTFTKRHMHYLMLNNIKSDNELLELLRKIEYNKTILIIEDIDCMTEIIRNRTNNDSKKDKNDELEKYKQKYKKLKENQKHNNLLRDNIEENSNLTLSGLLNALDGVFNNDGRIMIMTTNHPEVLDDALIRSGRVDRKIQFDFCTREQIKNIYKMMFDKECISDKLENIEEYKYSPADITSLFLRYRSNPEDALDNIDKMETKPTIVNKRLFSDHVLKINENENNKQNSLPDSSNYSQFMSVLPPVK